MSRIHDALRKAGHKSDSSSFEPPRKRGFPESDPYASDARISDFGDAEGSRESTALLVEVIDPETLEQAIHDARECSFNPLHEALLVDPARPREAPGEEFRSLRTRLNHLQTQSAIHTLVVTSASPAEGKSFTAANLAITQAQLANKRILLADFDFRRPSVDTAFQIDCAPGLTDYLRGKAALAQILRRVEGMNLYVLTAGQPVQNPLELLNLPECKALIDGLRNHFDWMILDSPPLLFAADGNLLATMCDATILVVRIGATTFDSVTRAMQSLCENNVIGVVVNGASRGELYSKYTYYHDYYDNREPLPGQPAIPAEAEPEPLQGSGDIEPATS